MQVYYKGVPLFGNSDTIPTIEITKTEWDELTEEQKAEDVLYLVDQGNASPKYRLYYHGELVSGDDVSGNDYIMDFGTGESLKNIPIGKVKTSTYFEGNNQCRDVWTLYLRCRSVHSMTTQSHTETFSSNEIPLFAAITSRSSTNGNWISSSFDSIAWTPSYLNTGNHTLTSKLPTNSYGSFYFGLYLYVKKTTEITPIARDEES